jgi:hypothetical protein
MRSIFVAGLAFLGLSAFGPAPSGPGPSVPVVQVAEKNDFGWRPPAYTYGTAPAANDARILPLGSRATCSPAKRELSATECALQNGDWGPGTKVANYNDGCGRNWTETVSCYKECVPRDQVASPASQCMPSNGSYGAGFVTNHYTNGCGSNWDVNVACCAEGDAVTSTSACVPFSGQFGPGQVSRNHTNGCGRAWVETQACSIPDPRQPVVKDGSANFQRRGDYTFTIPEYTWISFVVDGGGGSAARPVTPAFENPTRYNSDFGTPGNDGGSSVLNNLGMVGSGGGFGNGVTAIYRGCSYPGCRAPYPYNNLIPGVDTITMTFYRGADGNAGGGDENITGGARNGGAPTERGGGNGGGDGGRAIKTFTKGQPGAPVPGQVYSLHVGAGGDPAVVTEPMRLEGITTRPGGEGAVYVNWKYEVYE